MAKKTMKPRFVQLTGARFRFLRDYRRGESLRHNELVLVDPRSVFSFVVAEGPV